MTELRIIPILAGMLFVVGGCAQQPAKTDQKLIARAARYGVSPQLLVMAGNYGYLPETSHGKTLFCRDQESTGSYIADVQCVGPERLQAQLDREARQGSEARRRMERTPAGCAGQCMPTP